MPDDLDLGKEPDLDLGKEEPLETVVRQYPRDDALGLGSAPRIHPPPMRKRLHGGLQ